MDSNLTRETKALVIGFGSIGIRHARILSKMGCSVAVLSRRSCCVEYPFFHSIKQALREFKPEYVVIANETSQHIQTLIELANNGYQNKVLIEKPLAQEPVKPIPGNFSHVAVGYNLRFHPVISALQHVIKNQRVIAVRCSVGLHLPKWRPQADYRLTSSAYRRKGGGVLRDLSHELDYLFLLFGSPQKLIAHGGKLGPLEIDSDDCWSAIMTLEDCPQLSLNLDYFDRKGHRWLLVHTHDHTFLADLMQGSLWVDNEKTDYVAERDDTYKAQHLCFLKGTTSKLCNWSQAQATLHTISAVEQSAKSSQWVTLALPPFREPQ